MSSPTTTNNHILSDDGQDRTVMSPASTSSSSLSTSLENTNTSATSNPITNIDKPLPPPPPSSTSSSTQTSPNPSRSLSATTTPTIRSPPIGGGSQTKRHSVRSNSASQHRQASSSSLDRSISQPPQRPTSPITSPSIHKSLTALDAKSITRDMEKSALQLRGDDVISPNSPNTSALNSNNFYFSNAVDRGPASMSFQSMAAPTASGSGQNPSLNHYQYHRQNSLSSVTLPTGTMTHNNINSISNTLSNLSVQGDAWQTLCVRVLPLFNGEGVQGAIEDLNELLRYRV
jgi:hypothetical protein